LLILVPGAAEDPVVAEVPLVVVAKVAPHVKKVAKKNKAGTKIF
jgi:hypothetical protein